jgi:hypothetical protein
MGADPSLQGEGSRGQRAQVYLFLAECLADEQRFNTMGRISTDVLGAYLDGDSAVSQELLYDALAGKCLLIKPSFAHLIILTSNLPAPVLSTPAFKIKVIGSSVAGAQDDDDAVADVMAAASAKVVGALVKKHILQTVKCPQPSSTTCLKISLIFYIWQVVPVLAALKRSLQVLRVLLQSQFTCMILLTMSMIFGYHHHHELAVAGGAQSTGR